MGIGIGSIKYVIGVLLSGTGFMCMYIFGGGLVTLYHIWHYIFQGNFIEAFVIYYITSALPPTSIEQVFGTAILGACFAGVSWFIAMAKRGVAF